jgi:hypothetical protein
VGLTGSGDAIVRRIGEEVVDHAVEQNGELLSVLR